VERRGGSEPAGVLIRRLLAIAALSLTACVGDPGTPVGKTREMGMVAATEAAQAQPHDSVPRETVGERHAAHTEDGRVVAPLSLPAHPIPYDRPSRVRGIYLNAWAAGSGVRTERLVRLANRTELNTFVIDLKDASGFVSHPTRVALAQEVGADQEIRIADLPALLRRLDAAGIYPVARIVVAKDPILAGRRPDLAIQDSAGGTWVDDTGSSWVNLYDPDVWEYNVALAREAARVGFGEIQWDYVRFPDGSEEVVSRARYPGAGETEPSDAVRAFLRYAGEALADLDVVMTVDVFGIATAAHDGSGVGQLWEKFIDRVDVALPMVYPSHYGPGSYGLDDPGSYPYEVVRAALTDARDRSDSVPDAGRTRPWLQDFSLSGAAVYGAPEVRAQIQAAYDAGIHEWILWNASAQYSEAALIPVGGLPGGTELTMRLGGRVVPVSQRLEGLDAALQLRIAERRLGPVALVPVRFFRALDDWMRRID
jgi:hypothetical protein